MGVKDLFKKVWQEIKVIKGDAAKDKLFCNKKTFPTKEVAVGEFQRSKEKLFYVNGWSQLPGITSGFTVYTPEGKEKPSGKPDKGDFIFIDLPGPTPETWVEVIDVKESEQEAEFTVRPSPDPREGREEIAKVEHFFADEATSTFKVELVGNTIFGYEIGKEEGINNQGKEAGGREVINTIIAFGGWIAFQEIQWDKLTRYLVHEIESENQ